MADRADPPRPYDPAVGRYEASRCQTNDSGRAAFVSALRANPNVPAAEKDQLAAAREALNPWVKPSEQYLPNACGGSGAAPPAIPAAGSPAGREFALYLTATEKFYAGDFDAAGSGFRAVGSAADPWVRETALYMVARNQLNAAIERSMEKYGDLAEPKDRDRPGIAAAGAAFEEYLRAYPSGRYANSASGLMRRVHWLAGDESALAAELDRSVGSQARFTAAAQAVALVNEVDSKLPLPTNNPSLIRDPVLLAVVDLHRMRQPADASDRSYCCGPAITTAEIERQRPLFGADTELYDYIRAAEAYFVRHQPREVVQLLPDAANQQRFSYLQFSRQMLRGLALQDLRDRNARGFWLSLFPGATQPYQREALELALAMHDEQAGRLDLIFARDSLVRHPLIRGLLLEHVAGPDILRQQASRTGVPRLEPEVALYMLLSKELRRGFYREFLGDLRLLPADAATDTYFGGATAYDARFNPNEERPPLGKFGAAAKLGNFGCPALTVTVSLLATNRNAIRPRLCLAEYFRNNGFDDFDSWYGFDEPVKEGGLASTRQLFPAGTPYARLETYKAIMADPSASADDKALALNRAVRCYAPAGNNSCGGTEVPLSQRRAWYNRLKADYPQSRWAKELKFYW
jgi:hypothetical protein